MECNVNKELEMGHIPYRRRRMGAGEEGNEKTTAQNLKKQKIERERNNEFQPLIKLHWQSKHVPIINHLTIFAYETTTYIHESIYVYVESDGAIYPCQLKQLQRK